MNHHLVVTKPFLHFSRGDIIADATQINKIMSSEYGKFVTKLLATSTKG